MADERLYFEDLVPGREWMSATRVVTAADVVGFAELTGDRNPVHLDPAFARSTPFRRCVAHGLLGLALTGGMAWTTTPVRVVAFLGLREWHFRVPIYFGDAIRAKSRVLETELQGRGRRGIVTWRVEVLNQDDRLVQEGVTTMLVETARCGGRGWFVAGSSPRRRADGLVVPPVPQPLESGPSE